jgi:signal transduction histidine kinase
MVSLVSDVVKNHADLVNLEIDSTTISADVDDARIRILLRNLISNAIQHGKATATNMINVSLSKTESTVVIRVVDHGPGIPEEHIDKIADPFYRPDESRTRSTGGFGMGMNLVKRIVHAHGGSMDINSQVSSPSGTSVEISLPLNRT